MQNTWDLFARGGASMDDLQRLERVLLANQAIRFPNTDTPTRAGMIRFHLWLPGKSYLFDEYVSVCQETLENSARDMAANGYAKHDFLARCFCTWYRLRDAKEIENLQTAGRMVRTFCIVSAKIEPQQWQFVHRVSVFCVWDKVQNGRARYVPVVSRRALRAVVS